MKVLLLENIHDVAREALTDAGFDVETRSGALDEPELVAALEGVDMLGIRSKTHVTRAVLEARPELKVIGAFCIGTNQIDLDAASQAGTVVFNAPFSNTRSVVELAMAEIISMARHLTDKNAALHAGVWDKSAKGAHEVRGRTLGIIGYGNIGTQFSVLAEGLGMDVYFYDVVSKLPIGNATQVGTLQELLNISDVVSLHVPETPATKYMFKAEQFAQMKPGSILMNASRGTVVDIDALADALRSGKLLGAAIDVFPVEPKSNTEEFVSPLREFDNVILTPHVGGSTIEAQENIGREVAEKLAMYSDNGTSVSSVNFPEVALPSHPNQHRLLHIHENVPGVMSEINQVFSENGINVCGQYLQTKEDIGYVVVDVDKAYGELALEKLRQVKGTIRCRVLF